MANKKQLVKFHRENIINAAEQLFSEKGLDKTTMDDISKAADYSKATIYVYFKNKDEIYNCIILKSMLKLKELLLKAITKNDGDFFMSYFNICNTLAEFHENNPLYFNGIIGNINVDIELEGTPQVFRDIFNIGEEIDDIIKDLLLDGISKGIIREDIKILQTIFVFWAGLTGLIQMAENKKKCIEKTMGDSKEEFLHYGFTTLINSITKRN